ncbi:MAG: hypothetical protein AAB702_01690 [Patescibacteria group bacterium]
MPDNINLQQVSKLLDEKLAPIQRTLDEHGRILKGHGKLLNSLKKDQDTMLNMLDREQMNQRKRLVRVEKHLELTPPTL